MICEEKV